MTSERGEFTPFYCPREPAETPCADPSTGLALLQRAAFVCSEHGLSPHADAVVGALSLAIIQMVRRSPDDMAEEVMVIARMMRREK